MRFALLRVARAAGAVASVEKGSFIHVASHMLEESGKVDSERVYHKLATLVAVREFWRSAGFPDVGRWGRCSWHMRLAERRLP